MNDESIVESYTQIIHTNNILNIGIKTSINDNSDIFNDSIYDLSKTIGCHLNTSDRRLNNKTDIALLADYNER